MSVEGDKNCISFVMSHFGIMEEEKYISPARAMRLVKPWFELTDEEKAQVVMVYNPSNLDVPHIGLLDPDHSFIVHRPMYGAKVRKDAFDIAIGPYQQYIDTGDCELQFLRFLGKEPAQFPRIKRSTSSFLPKPLRKYFVRFQCWYYGEPYSF